LRPAFQRVAPLASLDLDEFRRNLETFRRGEAGERFPLPLDPEARPALLACADSNVGNYRLHGERLAADAAYFNPPDKLARVATAHRYTPFPTLEQIRTVLDAMPASTDIERRDRALIAFAIATGARDRAIISVKLKHVDLDNGRLDQDARQVGTKRAKTFSTWFFPVGENIRRIVADWVTFLRTERGFDPEDPIFPKARVEPGVDLKFCAAGLDRAYWSNANAVRTIFREAFDRVGVPYSKPHSFRNTLVQLAYDLKLDPERFRAWSQNLGHESCLTTFSSYGTLPPSRQGDLIRGLGAPAAIAPERPAEAHRDVAAPPAAPLAELDPDMLRRLADQVERAQKTA
jgi:integrase